MIQLEEPLFICYLQSRITNARVNTQKLNKFGHKVIIYFYSKAVVAI